MLECESLVTPLGMDAKKPVLSWKLQDTSTGAQQTAYEIQVASSGALLAAGKPDVWDSEPVESGDSIGVGYGGPALIPSKRYFWRVLVWGRDGKPYPPSDVSWWETGLLQQENWKAKWIGYEEPEHKHIRESGAEWITNSDTEAPKAADKAAHDFRFNFAVARPVRRASLYVTGQDSASAWINGKQVLEAEPLPAWKQMPWKTYTIRDISEDDEAFCRTAAVSRGLACADLNGDGALDLLVTTIAGPARLYRNVAPKRGHWLLVRALDSVPLTLPSPPAAGGEGRVRGGSGVA